MEAPYFNAGMQLIDLQPWRARNFGAQAISYAEENPEIVDWLDQDALNVVVGSDWSALPASWNWCTGGNSPGEFTSARIIHFTEQPKPNHVDCSHPAKQLFSRHRRDTPWRNSPLYPSQAKVRPRVLAGIGAKIAALKDLIFRRYCEVCMDHSLTRHRLAVAVVLRLEDGSWPAATLQLELR